MPGHVGEPAITRQDPRRAPLFKALLQTLRYRIVVGGSVRLPEASANDAGVREEVDIVAGDADRRVARSKAAIMATTLKLLAERGVAATTIDAISERSGVAKTTIYRHWPSKPEVVVDAIGSVLDAPVDPDTGDLTGDLCALLHGLAEGLADEPLQGLMSSLMEAAAHDAELADLHRRHVACRHDVVRQALRRGIDRGELSPDVDFDEIVAQLAGPIFYQQMVAGGEVTQTFVQHVVDGVLTERRPA